MSAIVMLLWMACSKPESQTPIVEDSHDTVVDVEDTGVARHTGDTGHLPDLCDRNTACAVDEVCDLALGRCERRVDDWGAGHAEIFSVRPQAAAPGDVVVIDGLGFWTDPFRLAELEVHVGAHQLPLPTEIPDSTRLSVQVTEGLHGDVILRTEFCEVHGTLPLELGTPGVRACTGETPEGGTGADPSHAGAFAAGQLDLPVGARLYYPARCGGLRTPAVSGTRPMVVLLHANGVEPLNYDYLGQHLATWGFVSVLPKTVVQGGHDVLHDEVTRLHDVLASLTDHVLSAHHDALTGLSVGSHLSIVAHSRGAARAGHLLADHRDLAERAVGVVWLGPVDDGHTAPLPSLHVQATNDLQANFVLGNAIYDRFDGPKWQVTIHGGNHGLFTDHKVWPGHLDLAPTLPRQQQHDIVRTWVLPFLQRVHGLDEPFSDVLDGPLQLPHTEVRHSP
jgi:dienelactone hydrolase